MASRKGPEVCPSRPQEIAPLGFDPVVLRDTVDMHQKENRNKEVVREYIETIHTPAKASAAAVEHLCTCDAVLLSLNTFRDVPSPQAYADLHGELGRSMPDLKLKELNTLFARSDCVSAHYTVQGTHTGAPWRGIPATGKKTTFTALVMYQLHDFHIRRMMPELDKLFAWRQLGWAKGECQMA